MEIHPGKLKWFIFGLLCFALGAMSFIGYSLTPSENNKYQGDTVYGDRHLAILLIITLMPIGFVIVLVTAW